MSAFLLYTEPGALRVGCPFHPVGLCPYKLHKSPQPSFSGPCPPDSPVTDDLILGLAGSFFNPFSGYDWVLLQLISTLAFSTS